MKRVKPEEGVSLGQFGLSEEKEKRQARIGVITNLAIFASVVFAIRVGKGYQSNRARAGRP